jgi:hypothetical protein
MKPTIPFGGMFTSQKPSFYLRCQWLKKSTVQYSVSPQSTMCNTETNEITRPEKPDGCGKLLDNGHEPSSISFSGKLRPNIHQRRFLALTAFISTVRSGNLSKAPELSHLPPSRLPEPRSSSLDDWNIPFRLQCALRQCRKPYRFAKAAE